MRNASVASEFLFPLPTSTGRIDILPRRATSSPAREYPAIFAAGLIRLSCIRWRHVTASASEIHAYRSYLSP